MKKQNTKSNRGITLIALIITIIILLILAMVSIRLLINGGIIRRTESATNQYRKEQEKEQIALAYSEYKMSKYLGETPNLNLDGATVVDNGNGWTVEFENGNSYNVNLDGTISDIVPDAPVVNPYDASGWKYAYVCTNGSWGPRLENNNTTTLPSGDNIIVAKIYEAKDKNGNPIPIEETTNPMTGRVFPSGNAYSLVIEGKGNMGPLIIIENDIPKETYAWNENVMSAEGDCIMPYILDVTICHGVTNIGTYAFVMSNITSINIASSVETIDSYAFQYAQRLENITIPNSVTEIRKLAFQLSKIQNITLSENLEIIEKFAFEETQLKTVKIPSSVRKIEANAFGSCSMLKEVYIYTETCEFGYHTFEGIYVDIYYASRRKS